MVKNEETVGMLRKYKLVFLGEQSGNLYYFKSNLMNPFSGQNISNNSLYV
jgi:hypothetical protein